jgi:hypothetical protein
MSIKTSVWTASVCAAALLAAPAFAADNWVGTWKLNTTKSQLGTNAIRAQTLTFAASPDGIKLSTEGTDAQGQPMKGGYVSKFDGKDVPWTGNPMADTASPKRIDNNTYENTWKKGGKVTVTAKISVSPDGKTMTVTQTGTDPEGKPVTSIAVYDRQ